MSGPFGSTPHNLFNTTGADFYNGVINQSLRFDEGDTAYLDFTPSQDGTDNKKYTISLWVKLAQGSADFRTIFSSKNTGAGTGQGHNTYAFGIDDDFETYTENGAANPVTSTKFRDRSSWYNVVIVYDSTQAVDTSRIQVFINGVRENTLAGTFPGQNSVMSSVNTNGQVEQIGKYVPGYTRYFNGYMAEFHMVDGQALAPTNFGELKQGVWIPKEYEDNGTTSHGVNGFHLTFQGTGTSTTSQGTTAQTNIGDDQSGNGNNFAVYNFGAHDVVPDTPENNWCTFNQESNDDESIPAFSQGGLVVTPPASGGFEAAAATFTLPRTGKWYWEYRTGAGGSSIYGRPGIITLEEFYTQTNDRDEITGGSAATSPNGVLFLANDGQKRLNDSDTSFGNAVSANDIIGQAYNADTGQLFIYINNSIQASGAAINESIKSNFAGQDVFIMHERYNGNGADVYNFGQDSTFVGAISAGGNADANGRGDFAYAPPSGYLSLCAANLTDTSIGPNKDTQGSDHFDTITYLGNGQELAVGTGGMRRPLDTMSIAQSLRFDDSSLHYDITSSGNTRTFTFSAWVKRSSLGGSNGQYIYADGKSSSTSSLNFDSNDKLYAQLYDTTGSSAKYKLTTREFKDIRTWYHIVWRVDTTQSTAADRSRIYINGEQITAFDTEQHVDQNDETTINASGNDHLIGAYNTGSTSRHLDGYMAEINFADGQSYGPENFGQTGANGDWIPKTLGTISYGTNGFRLDFADSSDLGNNANSTDGTNDFDVTDNISSHDQVIDSPTQNFATFDVLRPSGTTLTLTEGALKAERTSTQFAQAYSNVEIRTGKFYAEFYLDVGNSGVGIIAGNTIPGSNRYLGQDSYTYAYYFDGRKVNNNSYTSYGDSYTVAADGSSDIVGVMIDADIGAISFTKNGTVQNSGTPAFSGIEGPFRFAIASEGGIGSGNCFHIANFGQDDTFAGLKTSGSDAATDENGKGKFYDTPPTGFLALMDDNLPRQGDVVGPDWVWIKGRSNTTVHSLHDTLRGTQLLQSSSGDGQQDNSNYLLSFDSQGFTVGDSSNVNQDEHSYVAWTWKAGGAPTADNSAAADAQPTAGSAKIDGSNKVGAFSGSPSIAIKKLSASTTAGFSIVRWTGTGSAGTIPHGLGAAPDFYTVKNLTDDSTSWQSYHVGIADDAETDYIYLNSTAAADDSDDWNDTAPTANVFSVKTHNQVNASGDEYIAYLFTSIEGYSKHGRFTGNANADGVHVHLNFRPAWLMIKSTGSGGWHIFDNKRSFSSNYLDAGNEIDVRIEAQDTGAENTSGSPHIDFLSNGFKLRTSFDNINANATTHIFLAFAESPFKYSNAR